MPAHIATRHKNQKAPDFVIGGLANHSQMIAPGYMNVPFPALCRVSAARVGKQSVWGLRIITELTYYSAILP
jgi:hypothetical protein